MRPDHLPALTPVPIQRAGERHLAVNRTFQGIPGLAASPGGRLFAVWFSGGVNEGPQNFVLVALSDDCGNSWSDACFVVDPPHPQVRAYDSVPFCAPDGKLHLFWTQCVSAKDTLIFDGFAGVWHAVLENPDAPLAELRWSPPQRIADGVMLNKPLILRNGDWALPISVWNCRDCDPDCWTSPENAGAKMYLSHDSGITFSEQGKVWIPPEVANFDEHHFIELRDGRLWMLIRVRSGNYESFSNDSGRTWQEPRPSSIPGPGARMFVTRLQSGNLLLVNYDFETRPARCRLTAFLSEDDGGSWPWKLLLDERENVSYPDGQQLDDGTILIIHDHDRYHGGEILLSRFHENDIRAGSVVTSGSMLRLPVSSTRPVPVIA